MSTNKQMILFILFILALAHAQTCTTDRGREGICRPIKDCGGNWVYGELKKPLCAKPGDSFTEVNSLVCCL